VPADSDDDLDPLSDLPDETDELDHDFDTQEWPDDIPLAEDEEAEDAEPLADPFPEDVPDDAPTNLDDLEDPHLPVDEDDLYDEPITLSWKTTARLPDHDVELPALLDSNAEHSRWIGGPSGLTRVLLPGLILEVDLIGVPGPDAHLELGRDAISGKLLIAP